MFTIKNRTRASHWQIMRYFPRLCMRCKVNACAPILIPNESSLRQLMIDYFLWKIMIVLKGLAIVVIIWEPFFSIFIRNKFNYVSAINYLVSQHVGLIKYILANISFTKCWHSNWLGMYCSVSLNYYCNCNKDFFSITVLEVIARKHIINISNTPV